MAAPTVSDYAMQLLKPNGLTQSSVNPLDFLSSLMNSRSSNTTKPAIDPLDIALTGRMRADVGVLDVGSKNMMHGASAMKTTLEPLTRVQTLLGEMSNLTTQAGQAYGTDPAAYEMHKAAYEAKAQEVANIIKSTTFNGISVFDGSSWGSSNSSIQAQYVDGVDVDGNQAKVYAGTGKLQIQGGKSAMNVTMIDFGASAKAQGHSLVDLTNDAPWLKDTEIVAPTPPPSGASSEEIAAYNEARAQYEKYVDQYNSGLDPDDPTQTPLDPAANPTFNLNLPDFEAASGKLMDLQSLVGVAIARYGAFNGAMERQSAMLKGQSDIVKQAVTNQLTGSTDLEGMALDLLRNSIVSGRG